MAFRRRLSPTRHVDPDEIPQELKDSMYHYPGDDYTSLMDNQGKLHIREVGVNTFRFKRLNMFYTLRSLSWTTLITLSIGLYLMVLSVFAVLYYLLCLTCGSEVSVISAWYFTVVSLAANGGYMGEDMDRMTPSNICYTGRTAIVMACSYVNIIFVGLVAALVVGKAEFNGKLGQRIVFSDFCTLTSHRSDRWRISFRIANSMGQNPLIHGRLRLFMVHAEPLKEYHRKRREKRRAQRQTKAGDTYMRHSFFSPTSLMVPLWDLGGKKAGELAAASPKTEHTVAFANQTVNRASGQELHQSEPCAVPAAGGDPVAAADGEPPFKFTYDAQGAAGSLVSPADKTGHASARSSGSVDRYSVKTNTTTNTAGFSSMSDLPEETFERVKITLSELEWTCSEESFLNNTHGQLSLWFPVTIIHEINEKSPLYEFMQEPLTQSFDDGAARAKSRKQLRRDHFQLAAVFDATELESGATIVAKRTYTAADIIAHYRFSDKVVHLCPQKSEVHLDYHYFNELIPVMATESSTDSDDFSQ